MAVWMAYATLVGVLLCLAGFLTEAIVRGRGGPSRFAPLGAMVLTVLIPLFALSVRRDAHATALDVTAKSDAGVQTMSPALLMFEAPLRAASSAAIAERDYDGMLAVGWLAMSSILALCFVGGWVGLRRRRGTWTHAHVEGVDVLVAADAGPAAVGMTRPRIVLPAWALHGDRDALTLMVAHEAEHVRARDPLLLGAAGALLALMPWNPALWWQAARLRQSIELDCDARVLNQRPDPRAYAAVLLHVARGESRWLLASPGMARRRSLERRIRMLAGARRRGRVASVFVALGAIAFIVVACSVEPPARAVAAQPVAETVVAEGATDAGQVSVASVTSATGSGVGTGAASSTSTSVGAATGTRLDGAGTARTQERVTCIAEPRERSHDLVLRFEPSTQYSFRVVATRWAGAEGRLSVEVRGADYDLTCSGAPSVTVTGLPQNGAEIRIAGDAPEFDILVVNGASQHTERIRPGETIDSRVH